MPMLRVIQSFISSKVLSKKKKQIMTRMTKETVFRSLCLFQKKKKKKKKKKDKK